MHILRDAAENYVAWLEAIHAATRCIFFENYIIAHGTGACRSSCSTDL